jgi:glycosyltransferase involved in cell wall biosynthesis
MLIVFSGNTSWSMYNFRLDLLRKLVSDGYAICVIAPEDEYTLKIKEAGIDFYPVKKLNRSGINPLEDIFLLKEYISIYKKLKPSFVFHYTIKPNIYGTLAAKYCKIPSISVATGLGNAFSKKGFLFYFVKYLYKLSTSFSSEIWFLNDSDKAVFETHHIIDKNKGFVLPGEGVNTTVFKTNNKYSVSESCHFLLVSRMLYDKGVQVFVEATKHLMSKGYKINSFLLGQLDADNPESISIETIQQWQAEGLVHYLGSSTNVANHIDQANVVILPSYYKEGLPKVLLEAASMEKPIITTNVPGCKEVVDDRINGYLCNPKSVFDLAQKMELFIQLPLEDKINMGKAGREKVLKYFDVDIIIDIYKKKLAFHHIVHLPSQSAK